MIRPRRLAAMLTVACAAYPFVAFAVLSALRDHTPIAFDGTLTRLDGAAGHWLIVACSQILASSTVLRVIAIAAYDGSVIVAMLAIAARWRLRPGGDVILPAALLLTAILGPLGYSVVPAMGPAFFWPHFPALPAALIDGATTSAAFRNAMPSLHFAVSLLVAAALWCLGTVARAFGVAFVALTVLATLGFGEHYVIDLVVAMPFAAAVWLCVTGHGRAAAYWGSVSAVALLAIRLSAY
jgi:hypothetical protein